jgi:hypothetical protein
MMYRMYVCKVSSSVSDPYSFFTDPDPEVEAGDQYGPVPDPIRIQYGSRTLMTKNLKKITAEKKKKNFLIKNCNLPVPRPP